MGLQRRAQYFEKNRDHTMQTGVSCIILSSRKSRMYYWEQGSHTKGQVRPSS